MSASGIIFLGRKGSTTYLPLSALVKWSVRNCVQLRSKKKDKKKKKDRSLAGVAQWIEYHPMNQEVPGLIPGQSTC